MKFNKEEQQSPLPREKKSQAAVHAGGTQLESSFPEKDLKVLVDINLNRNQQCVLCCKEG